MWHSVLQDHLDLIFTASYNLMGDTTFGQSQYKKIYETLDSLLANWSLKGEKLTT
ncbi:MAG: hypothetical protein IPP27_14345 [Bacteroidetes bacterium]|nr:hypothetical protein [Bacteroidota bacterium]